MNELTDGRTFTNELAVEQRVGPDEVREGFANRGLRWSTLAFDGRGGPSGTTGRPDWPEAQSEVAVAKELANLVDAYIAKQPDDAQPVLQRVRRIIRRVLPQAEETVSYQIPTYKLGGQYVVYFAGWKKHWSLYPVTEPVRIKLASELASYELSKGTVRFPLADPVPTKLVEHIVRELAGTAEARRRAKVPSPRKQAGRRRTRG